jgi:tetratricopeptide (TPR) repeat protein
MTPEERADILDALVRLTRQEADLVDPLTTFLPLPSQRYALWPEELVILGGRGAGKTALFRLVNDARTAKRLRAFFEDDRIPEALWLDAFSQDGMKHPEVGTLEAWATSASDLSLRAFWMTHLLRRVHDEEPGIAVIPPAVEPILRAPVADLAAWLPIAEANLGAVSGALDAAERSLAAAERSVFVSYDNLDRVGQHEPGIRRRYVSTLLSLWLSLSNRYKWLRGKIFLRDDLFDAAELGFADAGKLRARAGTITWDHEALYRVVVRHLAGTSEVMRVWLREVRGLELRDRGEFGWVPGAMPDGVQREFISRLAWRVIGKGALKGETHRWIVNRLQDANRRVTPRAMLWFFGFAGEEAKKRLPGRRKTPLVADDLVDALRRTSRERVTEINEEYPAAVRMENLRGMKIPLDRNDVVARLGRARTDEREGLPSEGPPILSELFRLGVLKAGEDGQLDVPDIYRYAYEITPDYAKAWADFLLEDKPAAREMFIRDMLILGKTLPSHATGKWLSIAEDAIKRRDFAAARAECERALDLARSAGEVSGEAEVLCRLGQIDLQDQQPQRARQTFGRAIDLAKRSGDVRRQADLFWWSGMAAYLSGDVLVARADHEESARLSREGGDQAQEALALISLAETMRTTDPAKAADCIARSLTLSQGAAVHHWEAFGFDLFALLADARGSLVHAQQLVALAELTAKRSDVASIKTGLERWPALDPNYTEALRMQAVEAYARDRGWGVICEAFPEVAPPAAPPTA